MYLNRFDKLRPKFEGSLPPPRNCKTAHLWSFYKTSRLTCQYLCREQTRYIQSTNWRRLKLWTVAYISSRFGELWFINGALLYFYVIFDLLLSFFFILTSYLSSVNFLTRVKSLRFICHYSYSIS